MIAKVAVIKKGGALLSMFIPDRFLLLLVYAQALLLKNSCDKRRCFC